MDEKHSAIFNEYYYEEFEVIMQNRQVGDIIYYLCSLINVNCIKDAYVDVWLDKYIYKNNFINIMIQSYTILFASDI